MAYISQVLRSDNYHTLIRHVSRHVSSRVVFKFRSARINHLQIRWISIDRVLGLYERNVRDSRLISAWWRTVHVNFGYSIVPFPLTPCPWRSKTRAEFSRGKNALEGNEHLASCSPDCYRIVTAISTIIVPRLPIPSRTAAHQQTLIRKQRNYGSQANRYCTWQDEYRPNYFKKLSFFSSLLFLIGKGSPVAHRCSPFFALDDIDSLLFIIALIIAYDAIPSLFFL